MAKRTPQDVCLLCQTRLAIKRNSHIFSKFWVRSILGSDKQKEGYTVSSVAEKLGQKIQDSPKEDFIFCLECEARFGILERYVANSFYARYANPQFADEFSVVEKSGESLAMLIAEKVNPCIFKLFIYSLLWRASISTHPVFSSFKLGEEDEEKLRKILNTFVKDGEADTVDYCNSNIGEFESLPFNIVTTLAPADATANMIAPFDAGDGKVLVFANEFVIIVYLDWNAPREGDLPFNLGSSKVCVGIVSLDEWKGLHTPIVHMLAQSRLENFKG